MDSLFNSVGALIYNIIASALNALLQITAFFLNSIVLRQASVPSIVETIWHQSANVSTALITLTTIYALVKSSAQSLHGSAEDTKDIIGRAIVAVFLAQSSWTIFMEWLLPLNNVVVTGIMQAFNNININVAQGLILPSASALGVLAGVAMVGWYYALALLAILLIIAILVAVVVWLVRDVEIIMLIILAPIAASFTTISRNVNSWRWLVTEFISTIFSQSVLALFMYTSFSIMMSSGSVQLNTNMVSSPGDMLWNFAIGVTGVFMSFKAHSWLRGMITGERVTGDHGALALAAGFAAAKMGSSFMPGGAALNAKTALGQMGLGEFSAGNRRLQAARQANSSKSMFENPDFNAQSMASQAGAEMQGLQNPHVREQTAAASGLRSEVMAQGKADNAPAISLQQSRGQSAVAMDPGARAAKVQSMVDDQIAFNQDPQILAAKGVTQTASASFTRAARPMTQVDPSKMQQGFTDLSDAYQRFGYTSEEQSTPNPSEATAGGVPAVRPEGKLQTTNPYVKKQ